MSFSDLLRDTLATLWAHKRRTMLTMFGIAWGIISITFIFSSGSISRICINGIIGISIPSRKMKAPGPPSPPKNVRVLIKSDARPAVT